MTAIAAEGREMIRSFFGHEHEELIAGIDRLHEVAWDLPGLSAPETSRRLCGVLHWVEETLQPHMAWEEQWLLPTIDDRAPTRWATSLVRFDHRQIAKQTELLRMDRSHLEHGRSGDAVTAVRCDLFGLEALLRADIEREQVFLLPLLERDQDAWAPEWRD